VRHLFTNISRRNIHWELEFEIIVARFRNPIIRSQVGNIKESLHLHSRVHTCLVLCFPVV